MSSYYQVTRLFKTINHKTYFPGIPSTNHYYKNIVILFSVRPFYRPVIIYIIHKISAILFMEIYSKLRKFNPVHFVTGGTTSQQFIQNSREGFPSVGEYGATCRNLHGIRSVNHTYAAFESLGQ